MNREEQIQAFVQRLKTTEPHTPERETLTLELKESGLEAPVVITFLRQQPDDDE